MVLSEAAAKLLKIVAEARERRTWSEAELCRQLHIDQSLYSRIKHGEFEPTRKFLINLMTYLPEAGMAVSDYMREAGKSAKEAK